MELDSACKSEYYERLALLTKPSTNMKRARDLLTNPSNQSDGREGLLDPTCRLTPMPQKGQTAVIGTDS
jgi:hypothetical protein